MSVSLASTAGVVLSGGDKPPDEVAVNDGWSDDIRPLAEFVEDERGLEFKHPVPVRFLSDARFRKEVTSDESELTDRDRAEIRQTTGLLRAIGLFDGRTDLFAASNDLAGAGVIGLYSDKDNLIRVRGTSLTPATKVTLVHELTHALQDQYFDLTARKKELNKADDPSAAEAFQALVEGDASRIETAYVQSLSDDDRAAFDQENAKESKRYKTDVAGVPQILQTLFSAPYALGEAMLAFVSEVGGNDAINALFRDPPTTDEQLLDPWTLLPDRDKAMHVGDVQLRTGEAKFESGTFGALTWYLMLARHVPLLEALDAVDGWGGDAFVGFKRDGTTCVRAYYRGDTPRDTTEMATALRDWATAAPSSGAAISDHDGEIVFESCDPGRAAGSGRDSSARALQLAVSRTYVALAVMRGGADQEVARCVGDRVVHKFTLKQITGTGADAPDQAQILKIFSACRATG